MPFPIDAQGRFKLPYRILISLFQGVVAAAIAMQIAAAAAALGTVGRPQPFIPHAATLLVPGLIVTAAFGLLTSLRAVDADGRIRNGWKILGFIEVTAAISILLRGVINGALGIHHVGMLGSVVLSLIIGLTASWICLALERRSLPTMGYRLDGRWGKEFAWGVLGGAGIMLVTALVAMAAGGFHWTLGTASLGTLGMGALLFILVGFNEETLFRGYLFQRLVGGLGQWPAQILMGLFFAYAHWHNPGMVGATKAWATVNIALAAVLLGLCYLKTKSLALPIGVHIGWNFTQGDVLGFGVSGTATEPGLLQPVFHSRPEWLTGGAFGLEASLPCVIVCSAAIVALLMWKGRAAGVSGAPSTAQAS